MTPSPTLTIALPGRIRPSPICTHPSARDEEMEEKENVNQNPKIAELSIQNGVCFLPVQLDFPSLARIRGVRVNHHLNNREKQRLMARAGFYTVESGKISFRRDGNWYSDDERIDNPRIALLFSQSIKRNPDGSYYLQVAEERASITVEDTPYVVKALEDDELGGLVMVLNDDTREPLDPTVLEVGSGNVLYARVKGDARARFLRSAYYHLSDRFESDDAGRFYLNLRGRRYPIGGAAAANP